MTRPTYGVYEAQTTDGETFRFCCSNVRLVSLMREIEEGRWSIRPDSVRLIYTTDDRNEARAMATEF